MSELREMQNLAHEWRLRNFPGSDEDEQFLGIVEEVGELAHAILKMKQGIRGEGHYDAARDAVGDIMIFLMNYCSCMFWDLQEILDETWGEVSERDWLANPKDGKVE